MDLKNNINMDDSQQNSTSDAKNCRDVKYTLDHVKSNLEKHVAFWTPRVVTTLLKIYEKKLWMLKYPKKKTRLWIVISKCLKRYNIKVTPEQVVWVVNALTKRYKRCLNGELPARFKYFKEMHKIYAKFIDDQHVDTITKGTQTEQSINNIKLNYKINQIKTSKTFQDKIVLLRKARTANRMQSDQTQSKILLGEQSLQSSKKKEDETLSRDEKFERNLKAREEEQELHISKDHEFSEYRQMQMWERKHETLLRIEREKFEIIKKMASLH